MTSRESAAHTQKQCVWMASHHPETLPRLERCVLIVRERRAEHGSSSGRSLLLRVTHGGVCRLPSGVGTWWSTRGFFLDSRESGPTSRGSRIVAPHRTQSQEFQNVKLGCLGAALATVLRTESVIDLSTLKRQPGLEQQPSVRP